MESFEILKQAEAVGWIDPGYTEPLAETVERAQEWLAVRR